MGPTTTMKGQNGFRDLFSFYSRTVQLCERNLERTTTRLLTIVISTLTGAPNSVNTDTRYGAYCIPDSKFAKNRYTINRRNGLYTSGYRSCPQEVVSSASILSSEKQSATYGVSPLYFWFSPRKPEAYYTSISRTV